MRITNKMMTNSMLYNLTNNLSNVTKFNEYADGLRVHKPSDDPIAAGKLMKLKTNIFDNEQYLKNVRDTVGYYEMTENAIDGIQTSFKRLRTLAVQASNTATTTGDDLKKINAEIEEITNSLIKSANFNYAGKYIFSGYQSNKKLLNEDGTYNIDVTNRDVKTPQESRVFVGERELMSMSTNGIDIFGTVDKTTSMLVGRFQYSSNNTNLDVTVGGVTFDVPDMDGTSTAISKQDVLDTYRNAQDPISGVKLSSVADISYDGTGRLVIKARMPGELVSQGASSSFPAESIDVKASVYENMYTDTSGSDYEEGISSIQGKFERGVDYSNDNLDIVVGVKTYEVDESKLNGSNIPLTKDKVLDAFKMATVSGTNEKLDDVAVVYFDKHDNLVIRARTKGDTVEQASDKSKFKTAATTEGSASTKSELSGFFVLDGPNSDYRTANMTVQVGAETFYVDSSTLTGAGFDLKRGDVLKQFRNAQYPQQPATPTKKLSDVADVFFDQHGELVIKEKGFDKKNIVLTTSNPAGYSPVLKLGTDKVEASVEFSSFPLNSIPNFILDNADEIKDTPLYIVYNGDRKRVMIEDNAVLTSPATYVAALQTAVDNTFGNNKISVSLTADNSVQFETVNTPNGEKPSLKIEPVVTNKSSLINDLKQFSKDLLNANGEGINTFLKKLDLHEDRVLSVRAEIGAKYNRIKMIENRNERNTLSYTESLTNVAGVDMHKAILEFKQFDAVYRASLSMSSKIIQPSLIDFLR